MAASTIAGPATIGTGLTAILDAILFVTLSHDAAATNRTQLLCHLTLLSNLLLLIISVWYLHVTQF
jgi:hypothetical protein